MPLIKKPHHFLKAELTSKAKLQENPLSSDVIQAVPYCIITSQPSVTAVFWVMCPLQSDRLLAHLALKHQKGRPCISTGCLINVILIAFVLQTGSFSHHQAPDLTLSNTSGLRWGPPKNNNQCISIAR